jgi:hypothetical protein
VGVPHLRRGPRLEDEVLVKRPRRGAVVVVTSPLCDDIKHEWLSFGVPSGSVVIRSHVELRQGRGDGGGGVALRIALVKR